jgi:hypothetical protein
VSEAFPQSLLAAVEPMCSFPAPWCVAGGRAIDLFLDRVTRPHADVDLAILRDHQALLRRHLRGWTFEKVVDGRRVAWPEGERLSLPTHEIHARSADERPLPLELLLNKCDGDEWVFRRDATVRLPLDRWIVDTRAGIPALCPAIVLLYKAKSPRPGDEADFVHVFDALGAVRRAWLRAALERCHPGHPWISNVALDRSA